MGQPASPPSTPSLPKLGPVDLTQSVAGEEDPGASLDVPPTQPAAAGSGLANCPKCAGSGKLASGTCPDCHGNGRRPSGAGAD